jgi:CheY-like chemotaxis protein
VASSPSGKTVLCVDDEEPILSLLQATLEKHSYVCLRAKGGREALRLAAESQIDAVILDHSIPEMSAEEVILQLRKTRANTPIILFSGAPEIPPSTRAQVSALVAKGDGLTTLLAELRRLLRPDRPSYAPERKFPRYAAQLPFTALVKQGKKTAVIRGLSIDIAEGGMGGKMAGEIACDERVVICLWGDSELPRPLSLQAQVRYRNRDLHGFEFLNVNAAVKIRVQQLCQKLASA